MQACFELAHHLDESIAGADGSVSYREAGYLAQHFKVNLDALAHAGPLDFDRHLGAIGQHGVVHLGHRRRR